MKHYLELLLVTFIALNITSCGADELEGPKYPLESSYWFEANGREVILYYITDKPLGETHPGFGQAHLEDGRPVDCGMNLTVHEGPAPNTYYMEMRDAEGDAECPDFFNANVWIEIKGPEGQRDTILTWSALSH